MYVCVCIALDTFIEILDFCFRSVSPRFSVGCLQKLNKFLRHHYFSWIIWFSFVDVLLATINVVAARDIPFNFVICNLKCVLYMVRTHREKDRLNCHFHEAPHYTGPLKVMRNQKQEVLLP